MRCYINYSNLVGGSETQTPVERIKQYSLDKFIEYSFESNKPLYGLKKLIKDRAENKIKKLYEFKDESTSFILNLEDNEVEFILENIINKCILFFKQPMFDNILDKEINRANTFLRDNLKEGQSVEDTYKTLNNCLESLHIFFCIILINQIFSSQKFNIKHEKITDNVNIIIDLALYNLAKFLEICYIILSNINLKDNFFSAIGNQDKKTNSLSIFIKSIWDILVINKDKIPPKFIDYDNDTYIKIFDLFFVLFKFGDIEDIPASKLSEIISKASVEIIKLEERKILDNKYFVLTFRSLISSIANVLYIKEKYEEFSLVYSNKKYQKYFNPHIKSYYEKLEEKSREATDKFLKELEQTAIKDSNEKKRKKKGKKKILKKLQ